MCFQSGVVLVDVESYLGERVSFTSFPFIVEKHLDLFLVMNFKVKALLPLWLRQVFSLSKDLLIFLKVCNREVFLLKSIKKALQSPLTPHGIHTMDHSSNLIGKMHFQSECW